MGRATNGVELLYSENPDAHVARLRAARVRIAEAARRNACSTPFPIDLKKSALCLPDGRRASDLRQRQLHLELQRLNVPGVHDVMPKHQLLDCYERFVFATVDEMLERKDKVIAHVPKGCERVEQHVLKHAARIIEAAARRDNDAPGPSSVPPPIASTSTRPRHA